MQFDPALRDRQRALDIAIGNQRLEGLEPDPRTLAELGQVVRGEMTIEEVLESTRRRIAAGDLREMPAK